MRPGGRRFLAALLAAALLPQLSGHGLGDAAAVFTYSRHPEFPLEKFVEGDLKVLLPTFAQSYLYVAYRRLTGAGFDRDEREAILALWRHRGILPAVAGPQPPPVDSIKAWLDARNAISGGSPIKQIVAYRSGWIQAGASSYYLGYVNCPDEAFRTAAATLQRKTEKFGASSTEVKDWVQAQDQVFTNCAGPQAVIPASAGADADRTYQIAAAHFYAGNFEAAEKAFREIAQDASSPWSQLAPYLVGRTLYRKATLRAGPDAVDAAVLGQAEVELKKTLADKRLIETHAAAQRLLEKIPARLRPQERLGELSRALLRKGAGATLAQDLDHYTKLLDRAGGLDLDELSEWILTFQRWDKTALDHSVRKWEQTSSLPWLVVALTNIGPEHPRAAALLEAAGKIPAKSPAFPTVLFRRIRLMMQSGRAEEARRQLDQLLGPGGPSLGRSSVNLFLQQRLALARSFEEFLRYAPRVPTAISPDFDDNEDPWTDRELKTYGSSVFFDADATQIFNRALPLSLLSQAARTPALRAHLRRELALAGWVRAALLDDEASTRELAPEVSKLEPALASYLKTYQAAPSAEARHFAAVFMMLRFPGLRPYMGAALHPLILSGRGTFGIRRDQWNWSGVDDQPAYGRLQQYLQRDAAEPGILTENQKATARAELDRLKSLGPAPNYLVRQVIEWGKAHPADPRVPEALHLAVQATRWGYGDRDTTKFSRAAFQLLHKRYPKSSWAAKTRYWY